MEKRGGGGCCIARYAGGAYSMSKVDRIMLRFRPIVPKPTAANGSPSGGATTEENDEPVLKNGSRKRRRAAKVSKGQGISSITVPRSGRGRVGRKKASPENTDSSGGSVIDGEKVVETLPLLPETPDVKERSGSKDDFPPWLSSGDGRHVEDLKVTVVGTVVKVECVTDTWVVDCYGLGRTDEQMVVSLSVDTCPGFVSDGLNRVRWTNAAYRRMVAAGEEAEVAARVVVVMEGAALPVGCAAFTCRVRVVTCGKERNSQTAPCDVWRMDGGGFAWRLDTTAALSLGR